MFLGCYRFDGDPADLLPAYDRLMTSIPPDALHFHTCVAVDGGIRIYDACPTAEVFASFSQSMDFVMACQAVGLPDAVVEPLGDIHAAVVRGERVTFD